VSQLDAEKCPVCTLPLKEPPSLRGDLAYYNCPKCGVFGLTGTALEACLRPWLAVSPRNVAIFSYTLRRMQGTNEAPLVDSDIANRITASASLPSPREQADNVIRWLRDNVGIGEEGELSPKTHSAIVGTPSLGAFAFVVQGLIDQGLVSGSVASGAHASISLTFAGWDRHEALKQGAPSGRNAFMAMQYGDTVLDAIVNDHFRPAIASTGFRLIRLDENAPAGLIDDRLRVEIRGARFLIADLTHRNFGSYWEAG
jgi:hypothetical protein